MFIHREEFQPLITEMGIDEAVREMKNDEATRVSGSRERWDE
jgi:hypothetical protein